MKRWKMNFNYYQKEARKTVLYAEITADLKLYYTIGMIEEVGEVAGKIKRVFRDNNAEFSEEKIKEIKYELGDVLWYMSELASSLNIKFDDIAKANIAKTVSRHNRNKIHGNGDNR